MPLANAIGIYLLAGTVLMGLGLMAKARWVASGKLKPPANMGKYEKLYFVIGTTLGVLFWPVFFIVIMIGWRMKRKTRKLERFLGYCEHSTAFEPICGPCSRDIERENAATSYIISPEEAVKRRLVDTMRRLADLESRLREKMTAYIKARPECLQCGKTGTLTQYLDSVWVKCSACGRRTYTPDPSVPEEVDVVPGWPVEGQMAGASYKCSICGSVFEGFPPATNAEGYPLCEACQKKPPG
jgi:DNA-directed RNA polymerase subunit RPC12/RpoP